MRDINSVDPHELVNWLRDKEIRELRLGVTDTGMRAQINGGAWIPVGRQIPADAATGAVITARTVM